MKTCAHCGGELQRFGQPKRFCSGACKALAYRRRRAGLSEAAAGKRGRALVPQPKTPRLRIVAGEVATRLAVSQMATNSRLSKDHPELYALVTLLAAGRSPDEIEAELGLTPDLRRAGERMILAAVDAGFTSRASVRLPSFTRKRLVRSLDGETNGEEFDPDAVLAAEAAEDALLSAIEPVFGIALD